MLVLSFCLGFSLVVGIGCYSVVAVCRPLSVCVVGGASLVAEHKLWGPRASVLWLKGSVVAVPRVLSTGSIAVAPRLNCSVARGIFLDQGSDPCLLHWQVDSQPVNHQGIPYMVTF